MSETPAINQQTREHPAETSPTGLDPAMRTGAGGRELVLVISVDVEEEGLFSGRHPRAPAGVANVTHLRRLEFISRDLGLPLTLLATHAVVQDRTCRELLLDWRERLGAELGAHLHPWNTPPLAPEAAAEPWRAHLLPRASLLFKLDHLLAEHQRLLGRPARSFRMGRFELPPWLAGHLPSRGLRVDSSLAPLRWHGPQGPPFACPADPHPCADGIWEAPLTIVPLLPGSERLVEAGARMLPERARGVVLNGFRRLGAAGAQPTMFSGPVMRLATRLHAARGRRVINMFLHSSELMPGGSPAYPDEQAVQSLVRRIAAYLGWLTGRYAVRGLTLGQIPKALPFGRSGEARP